MGKASYEDLADTWWKIGEVLDSNGSSLTSSLAVWHSQIFENVIKQCGWTVEEWNEVVNERNKKS